MQAGRNSPCYAHQAKELGQYAAGTKTTIHVRILTMKDSRSLDCQHSTEQHQKLEIDRNRARTIVPTIQGDIHEQVADI